MKGCGRSINNNAPSVTVVAVLLSVLFCLLFGESAGQAIPVFTAEFTVTASVYDHGYFDGTIYYDWTSSSLDLVFPLSGLYAELYLFNPNGGYDSSTGFNGQYLYKNSNSCPCETTTLNEQMPAFFVDGPTSYWTNTGFTTNFGTTVGQHYRISDVYEAAAFATDMWIANGKLLAFNMTDGRLFTIIQSTMITSAIPSTQFTAPTGCKCGRPLDIILSLDRTGSISYPEWLLEHEFVTNFSNSFEYGPLKTNMGILNWNSENWVTITLNQGVTYDAVSTAVNAMGCCSTTGCCCCGTDIGGGIYLAGQMMLTSVRPNAAKVIVVLTDGCQNHLYIINATPPVVACSCGSEQACETDLSCIGDISYHFNRVQSLIPAAKIIAVGVGSLLCPTQLVLAAGNNTNNVYSTNSWDQLSSLVEGLAATACTVDSDTCLDCCGICSCGLCIPPNNCTSPDLCHIAAPDTSAAGCCVLSPITCTPPDLCHTAQCDPLQGCVYSPKVCPPAPTCYNYTCQLTTGFCHTVHLTTPACNIPPPVNATPTPSPPQCYHGSDCAYAGMDKCIVPSCLQGSCYYNTSVVCNVSNACNTYACSATQGCYLQSQKVCNDGSKCTTDSCNTTTGCVFTPVSCPSPVNLCLLSSCDPSLGCTTTVNPCSNLTHGNCSVGNCVNGTCRSFNICVKPPPPTGTTEDIFSPVVVGASLGGAVVGIIIACIIVAVALAGGGAYAVAGGGGGGGATAVTSNPLYQGQGNSHVNPLHRA